MAKTSIHDFSGPIIEEKVIVKRVPEPDGFGWTVTVIRAVGPHKGHEKCVAMLCGGNVGKVLAAICAKQVAGLMMIDLIEIADDLATTED
jgi:hypothetical protein